MTARRTSTGAWWRASASAGGCSSGRSRNWSAPAPSPAAPRSMHAWIASCGRPRNGRIRAASARDGSYKDELFHFLRDRWAGLFGSTCDVVLFDLTGTCFEVDGTKALDSDLQRHGYGRVERPARPQLRGFAITSLDCSALDSHAEGAENSEKSRSRQWHAGDCRSGPIANGGRKWYHIGRFRRRTWGNP